MITEIDKNIFDAFPNLESKRLHFTKIQMSDSNDILKIRSSELVMKYMDTKKVESIIDSENFIKSIIETYKNKSGISWGIVEKCSNNFIGYFGFWKLISEHCRAEIGYALKPEHWRKGYMTETLRTMIVFGFNKIKLHKIEANLNPDNINSIKLLEKFGFKKEAYFRENVLFNNRFLDSIIYSLLQKDFKETTGN